MTPAGAPARSDDASTFARTVRAIPTLLQVSFADMTAYRAEIIIWFLTVSWPVIMMMVWDRVAEIAPVKGWDRAGFAGYFAMTIAVRQLTGSWVVWELNQLIRTGGLSSMLLKPVPPLPFLVAQSLAEKPYRAAALVPLLLGLWAWRPDMRVDPGLDGLLLGLLSITLAWATNVALQVVFACVAFWVEQSMGLWGVWFGLWSLLSGYLFPLELLPGWVRGVVAWLPFRATLAIPVEVLTGAAGGLDALRLIALQVAWLAGFIVLGTVLWRRGVRRYEAYGA